MDNEGATRITTTVVDGIPGYRISRLLDQGGYYLGFHFLGITTLVAALLCLGLYRKRPAPIPAI